MPAKLTTTQQRALYNALPNIRKLALKKHCNACQMRGEGMKEIMAKIGDVLGPIARELGPKVMKEIIVPLLMNYAKEKTGLSGKGRSPAGGSLSPAGGSLRIAGQGRSPAGGSLSPAGGSLRLAGQGKKMKKGSQEMKDHMARIRAMKKK